MDIGVAINNWKNFFRMVVGLSKTYPVKIVRSPEAQKYPMIGLKKDGDVGYDLPSTDGVFISAPTPAQRAIFENRMEQSRNALAENDNKHAAYLEEEAWSYLPKGVIPTGIRLEMPNNLWCSLEARSSSSAKGLITPDAIIDAGYRGELFAVVFNLGYKPYVVQRGERVAQIIFHERVLAIMEEVNELSASQRGTNGFGSTGN